MSVARRDLTLPFDDLRPEYQFAGEWQELVGSSRQWGSGVRSTQQNGATVSFGFFGETIKLFQTIPGGTGTVQVDVSLDGGSPQRISTACQGKPVFVNVFFASLTLAQINHTVVITNRGNPDTPFQFDKADILADGTPLLWPPSSTPIAVATTIKPAPPPTVASNPATKTVTDITTQAPASPIPAQQSSGSVVGFNNNVPNITQHSGSIVSFSASSSLTSSEASQTIPVPMQSILTVSEGGSTITVVPATANITTGTTDANSAHGPKSPTTLTVVVACVVALIVVVLSAVLFGIIMRRRSRRNRDTANKSTAAPELTLDTTAPNPFILGEESTSHLVGRTPVDMEKRSRYERVAFSGTVHASEHSESHRWNERSTEGTQDNGSRSPSYYPSSTTDLLPDYHA